MTLSNVVLLEEREVVGIEEHDAIHCEIILPADDAGTRAAEHGAGAVDRLEQYVDEEIVYQALEAGGGDRVPAALRRDVALDVEDVAGDGALPGGPRALERRDLRGGATVQEAKLDLKAGRGGGGGRRGADDAEPALDRE
jgi:hypothetical protein